VFVVGLYIDRLNIDGKFAFRIFHECPYFKPRVFFCKSHEEREQWVTALRVQAEQFEVNEKYETLEIVSPIIGINPYRWDRANFLMFTKPSRKTMDSSWL